MKAVHKAYDFCRSYSGTSGGREEAAGGPGRPVPPRCLARLSLHEEGRGGASQVQRGGRPTPVRRRRPPPSPCLPPPAGGRPGPEEPRAPFPPRPPAPLPASRGNGRRSNGRWCPTARAAPRAAFPQHHLPPERGARAPPRRSPPPAPGPPRRRPGQAGLPPASRAGEGRASLPSAGGGGGGEGESGARPQARPAGGQRGSAAALTSVPGRVRGSPGAGGGSPSPIRKTSAARAARLSTGAAYPAPGLAAPPGPAPPPPTPRRRWVARPGRQWRRRRARPGLERRLLPPTGRAARAAGAGGGARPRPWLTGGGVQPAVRVGGGRCGRGVCGRLGCTAAHTLQWLLERRESKQFPGPPRPARNMGKKLQKNRRTL